MPSCEDDELTSDAFYEALLDDDVEDLYEHAPCGYLSTTPDGTVIKVNQTFLGWTGLTREDVVGRRRFAQLLTAGGRIFYETHLAPMLRMQGRIREIAVEVRCAGGARLPVLVNAVTRHDPDGRPVVVRIAVFDATERRSYERELLAARQRAEESEARAQALARTLQASFLPPELPAIAGLDVAARYRPAGNGHEVGGDFYDVFEAAPGEWAVVLGDVCGKGVEAATVTALARYTVRAAVVQDGSPAHVLATLNTALLRQRAERFCTALHVRVELGEGVAPELTVCAGGHLLPLLVSPDGVVDEFGRPGTALGLFDELVLPEARLVLLPGAALVLMTDGVTEARAEDGAWYGEERVRTAVAAAAGGTADEIVDRLVGEVLEFQHGDPRDDVAVLVIRCPA